MLWSSSGVIFALKKTRASGRNVGKVLNPVVKLVLENQPFLMPEPAEKPSLRFNNLVDAHCYSIGRTGQILEQSCSRNRLNVKRFDHEGLHQLQCSIVTDEDLRGQNVLHSICFCYVIAQEMV